MMKFIALAALAFTAHIEGRALPSSFQGHWGLVYEGEREPNCAVNMIMHITPTHIDYGALRCMFTSIDIIDGLGEQTKAVYTQSKCTNAGSKEIVAETSAVMQLPSAEELEIIEASGQVFYYKRCKGV